MNLIECPHCAGTGKIRPAGMRLDEPCQVCGRVRRLTSGEFKFVAFGVVKAEDAEGIRYWADTATSPITGRQIPVGRCHHDRCPCHRNGFGADFLDEGTHASRIEAAMNR